MIVVRSPSRLDNGLPFLLRCFAGIDRLRAAVCPRRRSKRSYGPCPRRTVLNWNPMRTQSGNAGTLPCCLFRDLAALPELGRDPASDHAARTEENGLHVRWPCVVGID
jgi:hypothetical protein